MSAALMLLRKVPSLVWELVVFLAIATAIVLYAEHWADEKVRAQARADSTTAAKIVRDTVATKLTAVLDRAAATRPATITTGEHRAQLRESVTIADAQRVVVDGNTSAVPAAVVALILADDAKVKADDAHMAIADSIPPAVIAVVQADAAVEAAQDRQIDAGDSGGGGGHELVILSGIAAVIAAIIAFFH